MHAQRVTPEENEIMGTLLSRGESYDISDTVSARCILRPDRQALFNQTVLPSFNHNPELAINNADKRFEGDNMSKSQMKKLVEDPRDNVAVPDPRVRTDIPRRVVGPFYPPDNLRINSSSSPLNDKATIKLYIERAKRRDTDLVVANPQRILLYHALLVSEYRGKGWYQCKGTTRWGDSLVFDARFEAGNLFSAARVLGSQQYELMMSPDFGTCEHMNWFYFAIGNVRKHTRYTFKILNFVKPTSMFLEGAGILVYTPSQHKKGWRRMGEEICYYPNVLKKRGEYYYGMVENIYANPIVEAAAERPKTSGTKSRPASRAASKSGTRAKSSDKKEQKPITKKKKVSSKPQQDVMGSQYTLSFSLTFKSDEDIVFLASAFPYTYTDLNRYMEYLRAIPLVRIEKLTRTLMENSCNVITMGGTSQSKELIVILARVHPCETSGSYVLQGLLDFLSGRRDAELKRYITWLLNHVANNNPEFLLQDNSVEGPDVSLGNAGAQEDMQMRDLAATISPQEQPAAEVTPKIVLNPDGSRPAPPQQYIPPDLPSQDELFGVAGNYYGIDERYRQNNHLTAEELKELKVRLYKNELLRKFLLDKFLFKIVPMVNIDGVIVGNSRVDIGRIDLNKHWATTTNLDSPTLFALRELIQDYVIEQKYTLKFIMDIHGTSKQPNFFLHTNESINYADLKRLFWISCGQLGLIPNLGMENMVSFFTHDLISINTLLNTARERRREQEKEKSSQDSMLSSTTSKLLDSSSITTQRTGGVDKDVFEKLYKEAMDRHMATKNALFGANTYESMIKPELDVPLIERYYEEQFIKFVGVNIMKTDFAKAVFSAEGEEGGNITAKKEAESKSSLLKAAYKYTINPNEYALLRHKIMMATYKTVQETSSASHTAENSRVPSAGVGSGQAGGVGVRFNPTTTIAPASGKGPQVTGVLSTRNDRLEQKSPQIHQIPEESPYRLLFSEMIFPIMLQNNKENYIFDLKSCTYNNSEVTKPGTLRVYGVKKWACENIYTIEASVYGMSKVDLEQSLDVVKYGGILDLRNCNFMSMFSSETMDTTSEYTQDTTNSLPTGGDYSSALAATTAPGVVPVEGDPNDPKLGAMGDDSRVFESDWPLDNRHLTPLDYFIYGEALISTLGTMYDKNCEAYTGELEKIRADYVTWMKHAFSYLITNPKRDIVGFDMDKLSLSLKAKLKERIHIFAQFEALSNTEFDHVVSINKIIATTKVFDFLDKNGYDQPVSDSDDSQPPEYEISEAELKKLDKLKTKDQRLQEKRERLELRDCVKTMVMEQMNPEKLKKLQEKGVKGKKGKKGSKKGSRAASASVAKPTPLPPARSTPQVPGTQAPGASTIVGDSLMSTIGVRIQEAQSGIFGDGGPSIMNKNPRMATLPDTPDISRIAGPDETMRSINKTYDEGRGPDSDEEGHH
ncbi:Hypothetical protein DHA2_10976 [Giardia duodenalis]|uniref:Cytosolic carboxypeptidase N-terminal domain-containing protein n=1 Tax=Giardia intestinalis TaxID=5741 RepID=V6TK49_GIAIN|nr:Hypothetical protein DHA2_10976 [Giardia intestinalis]